MTGERGVPARTDLMGLAGLQRIGGDSIVTVNGITGVFTPVASLDPKDEASSANLQRLVESLRSELDALRAENEALKGKLAVLSAPPRSSDEFASGVKSALDALQSKLGEMTNPVSDFAVREFAMESKVHLEVTPLGTIGMRFVQPDESVNAAALSTVSMTVVPVPKAVPSSATVDAVVGVEAIDGLTKDQVATLRANHVATTRDFQVVATRATTSATLMSMLGVERDALGRMVLLADLLTVPGLDGLNASILYDGGIQDLATLAAGSPKSVSTAYARAARRRVGKDGSLPSESQVAGWIEAAQTVTGQAPS